MPRASIALIALLFAACSSSSAESSTTQTPAQAEASGHGAAGHAAKTDKPEVPIDAAKLEAAGGVAYFAGGCFWGVEHYMEQLDGVLRVESGYMGGHVDDPSYEQVSSQTSGHLETVRVYFDPDTIAYAAVAKRFFEIHDPTQANGQGPDIGPEYLSAVFVANDSQRAAVEGLIERLERRDFDVVTEIKSANRFWPAEEYHQNYYVKKGKQPYCHTFVDRFGDAS